MATQTPSFAPPPNLSRIQKLVHRTLRSWRSAPLQPQPLFEQLLFFRTGAADLARPSVEVLQDHYARLEAEIARAAADRRHAEVLLRRFQKEHSTQQIALDWHCSADHVNRVQREAIRNLALWLHSQEAAVRRKARSRLLTNLPASSYASLVGRDALVERVVKTLQQAEGPGIVALTGLGGLGKTALADAAVRQLIDAWTFDDVVWIRLQGGESSDWQVVQERLAEALLPDYLPGSPFEARLLQHLKQRACLMVLDNLEAESAQEWLDDLLALCQPSKCLVTHRQLPAALTSVHVIALDELERSQAESFLDEHTRHLGLTALSAAEFAEVYAFAGGNPLALKLVAGLLRTLSLASVLQALRQGSTHSSEALYKTIYDTAWAVLPAPARHLLLCFLLVGEEGASLEHLQAIDGLDEAQRLDALQRLGELSLLELRGVSTAPRYGVHRLTQAFLAAQAEHTPSLKEALSACAVANLRYWGEQLRPSADYALEEGNLQRALQNGLPGHWAESVSLLQKTFPHLRSKAAAAGWIVYFEQALEQAPDPAGPPPALHNQLGALAWLLEDFGRAEAAFQQAAAQAQPAAQSTAQVGLCLCHWAQGNHSRAAWHARQAQRLAPGEPRHHALQGLVAYSRGHFGTAEAHFRRALRLLGRRAPGLQVQLRVQRGLCQQMRGQLHQALKHYALASDALAGAPGRQQEHAHVELLRSAVFFQLQDKQNGDTALRAAARYTPLIREEKQAYFVSSLGRLSWQAKPTQPWQGVDAAEMVLNPLQLLRLEDFE